MKKTCNGCRAYGNGDCSLEYKTQILNIAVPTFGDRTFERMVPLEECSKPLTYDDYFFQLKLRKGEE